MVDADLVAQGLKFMNDVLFDLNGHLLIESKSRAPIFPSQGNQSRDQ